MSLELGYSSVTRSERETVPTDQKAGNIIGSVDNARRGALVRQVPLAEEPAESAAKKRQCVRNHRPHERENLVIGSNIEEGNLDLGYCESGVNGNLSVSAREQGTSSARSTAPGER